MNENLSHALYMAFAVFALVAAFTYALYMVNMLNSTAKVLVYRLDETNYYDSISLDDFVRDHDGVATNQAYKVVSVDSIIPTLYRYYKESFAVKILDVDGKLLQLFDANIEGQVRNATALSISRRTAKQKALLSLYGASSQPYYMFGAPWVGSTSKDTKERIDMYIAGKAGYINNAYVDYTTNNLNQYVGRKFKEIFSEYTYEGDTLSVEGDDFESITGTQQVSTKIIITYQLLP